MSDHWKQKGDVYKVIIFFLKKNVKAESLPYDMHLKGFKLDLVPCSCRPKR
jgi:hypothetical protein